jgi:hypothetical protein
MLGESFANRSLWNSSLKKLIYVCVKIEKLELTDYASSSLFSESDPIDKLSELLSTSRVLTFLSCSNKLIKSSYFYCSLIISFVSNLSIIQKKIIFILLYQKIFLTYKCFLMMLNFYLVIWLNVFWFVLLFF